MSSYYHTIPDPEEHVVCPYDPVHVVRQKKLQYHLMKCRKNFPSMKLVNCHFNARHLIPEAELRFHLATCPDKHSIAELARIQNEESEEWIKGNTEVPTYFPEVGLPDNEEDWNAEASIPRIGVQARDLAGIGYHKDLTGLKRAQKKAYYNNLRTGNIEANVQIFESMNTEMEETASAEAAAATVPAVTAPTAVPDASSPASVPAVSPAPTPTAFSSFAQPTRGRGRGVRARAALRTPGAAPAAPTDLNELSRLAKKTKKKLKQIAHLLDRQSDGEMLNEEERIKVANKATFEFKYNTIMAQIEAAQGDNSQD